MLLWGCWGLLVKGFTHASARVDYFERLVSAPTANTTGKIQNKRCCSKLIVFSFKRVDRTNFRIFIKISFSSILDVFLRLSALGPRKIDRADQATFGSGLRMSREGPDF